MNDKIKTFLKKLRDYLKSLVLKFWPSSFKTLVNLIFSLTPLLAVFLVVLIYEGRFQKIKEISGQGEIIIICIPIAVSIIYSLFQVSDKYRKRNDGITWPTVIFAITIIFVVISIFIYAYDYKGVEGQNFSLAIYSVVFLAWIFLAMVADEFYSDLESNVPDKRGDDRDELETKFAKMRDSNEPN